MLAANGSVGPSSSNNGTALLTVNGIIPNQQINGQQGSRATPILTPAYFPNTAFASFPVPFSGPTSVVPCITSPPAGTIFQSPGGQFPFNMAGSMLVAQPQPVINGTPISYSSFSQPVSVANTSPPTAAAVVLTTPITTDVCITSTASLSVIQNGTVSIAPSTMQSTTPNLSSTAADSTPSIKCKPEVKPVVPLGTVIPTTPTPEANMASLEKSNFNRELILEAIDKLRDRKARPDMEHISSLLRRQHNIPPSDTQICLSRLAEVGAVVCVDYKGNLSYRNPTKWRKAATSSGIITNRPNISRRLLDAVRSLIPEGGDSNQSFTLFQIEQALKQLKPSVPSATAPGENEGDSSSVASPMTELTGSSLRMCIEREAIFGKLFKLPDGRFTLDENGDKKRSTVPPTQYNRRPFLGKLPPQGTFGKPPIAPALDSISGKSYSVLSIAPGRPLARRPPFTTGKRGRPPSIKAKKMLTSCSQQPILPAPPDNLMTPSLEKRLKIETVAGTAPTTTFVPLDGTVMVSATPMPTLSLAPPPPPPASSGGATGAPAAMMMYPGIYNPTVFAVAPDTMVTTTFQPDTSTVSAAAGTVTMPTPAVALTTTVGTTGGVAISTDVVTETSVTSTTPANAGAANSSSTSAPETPKKERVEEATSAETDVCCRCHQKASENGNDKFLVCGDCGLKDHFFDKRNRLIVASDLSQPSKRHTISPLPP
ncbi:conserved hypothetical protein [Echinococcus multilocularis]|uniref:SAMD1-like winged helix (WH) domain-containing protein n=1 Tax=Echinococcus multilocularis TaxID=6211 RepID=A0A068XTR1_ECHMU|nr:conserved hypothetical protein [Echinococcus multilocularis]